MAVLSIGCTSTLDLGHTAHEFEPPGAPDEIGEPFDAGDASVPKPDGNQDEFLASVGRWPQFGFDGAQTRHNPDETQISPENVSDLELLWSTSINCSFYGCPIVADGLVHMGTYCGEIAALHTRSGTVAWKRRAMGGAVGTPLVANGMVYYGERDQRRLAAFDAKSGRTVWTSTTYSEIGDRSPALWNGLLIQTDPMVTYGFDAATGAQRWTRSVGAVGRVSPATSEGVFYLSNLGGQLIALRAVDGTILWTGAIGEIGNSFPAVDENTGTVFVSSTDRRLYAFSTQGCRDSPCGPAWWGALEQAGGENGVAVGDGKVYAGAGRILHAFDAHGCGQRECTPIWSAAFGDRIRTAPALANGLLYFGTDENVLYAVDARNGWVRWSYPMLGLLRQFDASVTVVDGVVYAAPTYSSELYAFRRRI